MQVRVFGSKETIFTEVVQDERFIVVEGLNAPLILTLTTTKDVYEYISKHFYALFYVKGSFYSERNKKVERCDMYMTLESVTLDGPGIQVRLRERKISNFDALKEYQYAHLSR